MLHKYKASYILYNGKQLPIYKKEVRNDRAMGYRHFDTNVCTRQYRKVVSTNDRV